MPAAAQATSAIGDYGRDLRPAKWGSGATAKQQSGARECPLWVCERGGVTGDALDFALETTRSKKSDVRDQLMSLFVTLDPCAVTPVGVSSHLVGKFRNLDQCKAAAA